MSSRQVLFSLALARADDKTTSRYRNTVDLPLQRNIYRLVHKSLCLFSDEFHDEKLLVLTG
jgi:hypothetical protein